MSNIYIQEPPTQGKVLLKTNFGDVDIELWSKEAPKACRNFVQLCLEKYYNNTIFHRIVKGFIAQGGDPTGTGTGGESIYGKPFKDEIHSRLRFNRRGLVAMANSGQNDNGSQFFFTLEATPELQGKHTIFGKVAGDTLYNMMKLQEILVDQDDRPIYEQKIVKAKVLDNPFPDIVPRYEKPDKPPPTYHTEKRETGIKNFNLLSFGEEAEEDEVETTKVNSKFSGKSKSTHDILADPHFSSEVAVKPEIDSENEYVSGDELRESDVPKSSLADVKSKLQRKNVKSEIKDEPVDEPYTLHSDRDRERKLKMKEIKKEIRSIKKEILNNDNRGAEASKKESKKVSDDADNRSAEYMNAKETYKNEKMKMPLKGPSRDDYTMQLLEKFKSKRRFAVEKDSDDNETVNKDGQPEDDSDLNSGQWLTRKLKCEAKETIARDANTKSDDWFEISDPRNPITKRRREESEKIMKSADSKRWKKTEVI